MNAYTLLIISLLLHTLCLSKIFTQETLLDESIKNLNQPVTQLSQYTKNHQNIKIPTISLSDPTTLSVVAATLIAITAISAWFIYSSDSSNQPDSNKNTNTAKVLTPHKNDTNWSSIKNDPVEIIGLGFYDNLYTLNQNNKKKMKYIVLNKNDPNVLYIKDGGLKNITKKNIADLINNNGKLYKISNGITTCYDPLSKWCCIFEDTHTLEAIRKGNIKGINVFDNQFSTQSTLSLFEYAIMFARLETLAHIIKKDPNLVTSACKYKIILLAMIGENIHQEHLYQRIKLLYPNLDPYEPISRLF